MPAFHEVLFPTKISYGSSGGPKFSTFIFTADSGFENRTIHWEEVRAEYNAAFGIKDHADMDEMRAFFMCRRGRAYGFRFKDWGDFKLSLQVIGEGDGTETEFQIVKTYISAQTESGDTRTYTRKIHKIAWDTIAGVTVGGVVVTSPDDYTVDHNTGIITFADPPPFGDAIQIGYGEFHVPVRFDTDVLDAQHEFWNTESWPDIPLVEDRMGWADLFTFGIQATVAAGFSDPPTFGTPTVSNA